MKYSHLEIINTNGFERAAVAELFSGDAVYIIFNDVADRAQELQFNLEVEVIPGILQSGSASEAALLAATILKPEHLFAFLRSDEIKQFLENKRILIILDVNLSEMARGGDYGKYAERHGGIMLAASLAQAVKEAMGVQDAPQIDLVFATAYTPGIIAEKMKEYLFAAASKDTSQKLWDRLAPHQGAVANPQVLTDIWAEHFLGGAFNYGGLIDTTKPEELQEGIAKFAGKSLPLEN
jgi:hypothetical protein